jgi:hypothetical protein
MSETVKGRPKNILTEQDIRRAMVHTLSNKGAARYLKVSFPTYRLYATQYKDQETGKTLFELHSNRSGKGIRKFKKDSTETSITEILADGGLHTSLSVEKLKSRLLYEGILAHECNKCKFSERRVTDYKVPLLLNFKDGFKSNWKVENLEMLCYNCYFLYIGDLFTKQQVGMIEDFGAPVVEKHSPDWELDDYFKQHFENLGLSDPEEDPGSEFIAKL